jgi:hypothetical protein
MLRPTIFGLFILVPQLYPCSCVTITSKCDRAWSSGETIFVGKVITIEKMANRLDGAAHFIAEESLRGTAVAGDEIVIHSDGSNCNYPFVEGASYVVYATKDARDGLLYPRWPRENRPYVATSKPANGAGPGQEYL